MINIVYVMHIISNMENSILIMLVIEFNTLFTIIQDLQ